uniref:Uncharacterized protein n=1 Tax=Oryza brachyantha TaxID=4533 RepID=J3N1J6_ORYBR
MKKARHGFKILSVSATPCAGDYSAHCPQHGRRIVKWERRFACFLLAYRVSYLATEKGFCSHRNTSTTSPVGCSFFFFSFLFFKKTLFPVLTLVPWLNSCHP